MSVHEKTIAQFLGLSKLNPIYDLTSISQGLGYVPPLTLTTYGSVLHVQRMVIMSFFQKIVYNKLALLPLF